MTFSSLQKSAQKYRSVFFAEEFIPRKRRKTAEAFFALAIFVLSILFLSGIFGAEENYLIAAFILIAIMLIKLRMLEAFCSSNERIMRESADFNTLSIVRRSDPSDLLRSLILSDIGEISLLRAGASKESLETYLASDRVKVSAAQFDESSRPFSGILTLAEYVRLTISLDPAFVALLAADQVSLKDVEGAERWISESDTREKSRSSWWSGENLAADFDHLSLKCNIQEPVDPAAVLPALLLRVPALEERDKVFFTFPALLSLADRTSCCIIGTAAPQRAFEILYLLPSYAKSLGDTVIRPSHVKHFFGKE